MTNSYQVLRTGDGDIFSSPGSATMMGKVDAVVFDCDGTLIDVRESYDATIIETVESMAESFLGARLRIGRTGREFILEIRRTGGFNSDWDLTYALLLFSAASLERAGKARAVNVQRLGQLVRDFSSSQRLDGWRSVDGYLRADGLESPALKELRAYLGYPGNPLTSRMAAAFDEVYYGEKLYRRIYGAEPKTAQKRGLIDSEKVIVSKETLGKLVDMLGAGRMAMATGRPSIAVQHTIGNLLGYFEQDASVYIGDGDIDPKLAPGLAKYRKPSGESLLLAKEKFRSKVLLYVGDSAEDRLMAENAGGPEDGFLFAGVYGSSSSEREQISYFTGAGSDVLVKDVNQIPAVLEAARA